MNEMECRGSPNLAVFCLDRIENGSAAGRLYHRYREDPLTVSEFGEVFQELEQLYDRLRFPRATTQTRRFSRGTQQNWDGKEMVPVMSERDILNQRGDMGTFVIRVQQRQNSTWQGRLTWTEENETQQFRSIWEMLKLIESAIGNESEVISWSSTDTETTA